MKSKPRNWFVSNFAKLIVKNPPNCLLRLRAAGKTINVDLISEGT